MVNMMREHVEEESRIHYVITKGGDAPNVVPNFSEGYYYVRHPDPEEVREMWERVVLIAKGAAMGTGTEVTYEVTGGVYNILPNKTLQKIVYSNLDFVGGVYYDEKERVYAKKIQKTLKNKIPLSSSESIMPFVIKTTTKVVGQLMLVMLVGWFQQLVFQPQHTFQEHLVTLGKPRHVQEPLLVLKV